MKKSTILLLVVVYVIAFFIVGLLGIQLRSHYQLNYLNEIVVAPFEETGLVLKDSSTSTLGDESDQSHLRVVHESKYTIKYTDGLVLKFNVTLKPTETSIDNYKLSFPDSVAACCTITKNSDKTIFVSNISKPTRITNTIISFTVEDNFMNGVKSTVNITITK